MPRINSPAELEAFRKGILAKRDDKKPCITLCSGSACHATGSEKVADAILADKVAKYADFFSYGSDIIYSFSLLIY